MKQEKEIREKKLFGLDPHISQQIDTEQELESMIVFNTGDELTDLPWYLISPKNFGYKLLFVLVQMMTWISVFLTPLVRVYTMMGSDIQQQVLGLLWFIDSIWCLFILTKFLTASITNRTFSDIAKAYLKSTFLFDILATIPPILTYQ